jgi:hypothetical protein
MNRRTVIKGFLAASFFGSSFYSGCKWISNARDPIDSIYLYKDLIAEIAETIIPATETPGAKDAKVEDFIINNFINNENTKSMSKFLKGLKDLQEYSQSKYNDSFQNCTLSDKIKILEYYEKKDLSIFKTLQKIESRLFGNSFIHEFKNLVVIGFCTSKVGATQALAYDYIPVNYQACIPLLKGQKSWATR